MITTTVTSFCYCKTFVYFCMRKKKTWKSIFNTKIELSQNLTEKQIMPFEATANWLFNDIWRYWRFSRNSCNGLGFIIWGLQAFAFRVVTVNDWHTKPTTSHKIFETHWFNSNKLSLNSDKSKFTLFHKIRQRDNIPLVLPTSKINNTLIKRVDHIKFLEVLFDENLTWKNHINLIEKKPRYLTSSQIFVKPEI